jgi:hypothetical protein
MLHYVFAMLAGSCFVHFELYFCTDPEFVTLKSILAVLFAHPIPCFIVLRFLIEWATGFQEELLIVYALLFMVYSTPPPSSLGCFLTSPARKDGIRPR